MPAKAKSKSAKPKPKPAPAVGASAPPPAAPQPAGLVAPPLPPVEYRGTLPLARLRPSPTNPRKTFDPASVAELAASIGSLGLLQPLLVRPVGPAPKMGPRGWEGVDHFEVIAGERRFRALQLNAAAEAAVTCWLLTDAEVAWVQLVENDQREDVRPSERAAAYAALAAAGQTAEQIAAATGVALSAVRDLVRLARLPAWLLAAVDAGEVAPTTAAMVARIPDEGNRKKAAACVLLGAHGPLYLQPDDVAQLDAGKPHAELNGGDEILTYRDAKDLLGRFQRELKGQPWRKALDLVADAVPCEDCPKRAGNAAKLDEAFAEARADTCLDVACFDAKTVAWGQVVAAKAEKKGRTVLSGEAAADVFDANGHVRYNAGYLEPDRWCYDDNGPGNVCRTYGELLKGHLEPVVAIGPDGKAHDLYEAAAAKAVLKEQYKIGAKSAKGRDYSREDRERKRKMEVGRRAAAAACGLVADGMAAAAGDDVRAVVRRVELLQQVAAGVADMAGADACRLVGKRRGLAPDPNNCRQCVEDLARASVDEAALLALIAELAAARRCWGWSAAFSSGHMGEDERALWAAFKVDRKALEAVAAAELKEKAAVKGKGAKPKAPAAEPDAAGGDDEDDPAGVPLAELSELPAAALDLLEAAGCLTLDQTWSSARQAADAELLKRPPQDVLAGFLAEIGADGHLVHAAASALSRELQRQEGKIVAPLRACRVCGCTQNDCRQCIEKTGSPCSWVEPDLCSACVPTAGDLKLSKLDRFPADVLAALDRKGVTTLGKLLELADDGSSAEPRTALFVFLERLPGVKVGPAATAADVVADHIHPEGKAGAA